MTGPTDNDICTRSDPPVQPFSQAAERINMLIPCENLVKNIWIFLKCYEYGSSGHFGGSFGHPLPCLCQLLKKAGRESPLRRGPRLEPLHCPSPSGRRKTSRWDNSSGFAPWDFRTTTKTYDCQTRLPKTSDCRNKKVASIQRQKLSLHTFI